MLSEKRERQISHDCTNIWNLKSKIKTNFKNRLINIEDKLVITKEQVGEGTSKIDK